MRKIGGQKRGIFAIGYHKCGISSSDELPVGCGLLDKETEIGCGPLVPSIGLLKIVSVKENFARPLTKVWLSSLLDPELRATSSLAIIYPRCCVALTNTSSHLSTEIFILEDVIRHYLATRVAW
jgi:hypothetical protein